MKTDVLILGAGLAGLRAAWAALETAPDLSVHVVSLRHGPAGSSFTNRNNRLGMRVPLTDEERQLTSALAIEKASPGFIDEKLVALMYDEAEARFDELLTLGFRFQPNCEGMKRVSGCFLGPDTAVLFDDLADAFTKMRTKVAEMGARFITDHEVHGLVSDEKGVTGAWLASLEDGRPLCLSARAVVMALGGPAPLFPGNLAGTGNPGISYALLQEAGASLKNTPYVQFFWSEELTHDYRMLAKVLLPGTKVRTAGGEEITLSDEPMLGLAGARATHCPSAYGLDDAAMDLWLLERADAAGSIELCTPKGDWERIYMAAHAGNGGAVIDGNGHTGVTGLFACGECATGMHGANRLGGAMVTATQVFGRRAGQAAALTSKKRKAIDDARFNDACQAQIAALPAQHRDDFLHLDEISEGLQAHALYHGRPGLPQFNTRLTELITTAQSRRTELAAKTALLVAG